MGKRRREDEEESTPVARKKTKSEPVEEDSDSDFSIPDELYNDAVHSRKEEPKEEKNKSKKKSVSFLGAPIVDSSDDERPPAVERNGNSEKSKKAKKASLAPNGLNFSAIAPAEDTSDCVVYLIRKPINVSLEDLQKVKMPVDLAKNKKLKLKTEHGNYALQTSETSKQLFYFPRTAVVSAKDSQNIRTAGVIKAQAVVSLVSKNIPGGQVFGAGDEIPEDLEFEYAISSKRKKPSLDLESRQQRLFAYGVKPKKKKSKKSKSNVV